MVVHSTIFPLNGGMCEGITQALGEKPSLFLTHPGVFEKNEKYSRRRWPDTTWMPLDREFYLSCFSEGSFDIVSSVPPCSGLSMFNSSKNKDRCGVDAEQNRFMIEATTFALETMKPKVFFFENAPGLYADRNAAFADGLRQIALQNNYGLLLVKTDTRLHGLPQKRPRTFAIFYRGGFVPVTEWQQKSFAPWLVDFLSGPNPTDESFRSWTSYSLSDDVWWKAQVKMHLSAERLRRAYKEANAMSLFDLAWRDGSLEKLQAELSRGCLEAQKQAEIVGRMSAKLATGGRVWDNSPYFVDDDFFTAVTGRSAPRAIHPTYDRFITVRECMKLMGLPDDYPIPAIGEENVLAQSVPVNTAKEITEAFVLPFVEGRAKMTTAQFHKIELMKEKQMADAPEWC